MPKQIRSAPLALQSIMANVWMIIVAEKPQPDDTDAWQGWYQSIEAIHSNEREFPKSMWLGQNVALLEANSNGQTIQNLFRALRKHGLKSKMYQVSEVSTAVRAHYDLPP